MHLAIFGSGYVGLVAGTCFAEMGNQVTIVDVDPERIAKLNEGHIPIYEPGLEELVVDNVRTGRLKFSLDAPPAIKTNKVSETRLAARKASICPWVPKVVPIRIRLTRLARLLKTSATITVPAARAIWRSADCVSLLTTRDYNSRRCRISCDLEIQNQHLLPMSSRGACFCDVAISSDSGTYLIMKKIPTIEEIATTQKKRLGLAMTRD